MKKNSWWLLAVLAIVLIAMAGCSGREREVPPLGIVVVEDPLGSKIVSFAEGSPLRDSLQGGDIIRAISFTEDDTPLEVSTQELIEALEDAPQGSLWLRDVFRPREGGDPRKIEGVWVSLIETPPPGESEEKGPWGGVVLSLLLLAGLAITPAIIGILRGEHCKEEQTRFERWFWRNWPWVTLGSFATLAYITYLNTFIWSAFVGHRLTAFIYILAVLAAGIPILVLFQRQRWELGRVKQEILARFDKALETQHNPALSAFAEILLERARAEDSDVGRRSIYKVLHEMVFSDTARLALADLVGMYTVASDSMADPRILRGNTLVKVLLQVLSPERTPAPTADLESVLADVVEIFRQLNELASLKAQVGVLEGREGVSPATFHEQLLSVQAMGRRLDRLTAEAIGFVTAGSLEVKLVEVRAKLLQAVTEGLSELKEGSPDWDAVRRRLDGAFNTFGGIRDDLAKLQETVADLKEGIRLE